MVVDGFRQSGLQKLSTVIPFPGKETIVTYALLYIMLRGICLTLWTHTFKKFNLSVRISYCTSCGIWPFISRSQHDRFSFSIPVF